MTWKLGYSQPSVLSITTYTKDTKNYMAFFGFVFVLEISRGRCSDCKYPNPQHGVLFKVSEGAKQQLSCLKEHGLNNLKIKMPRNVDICE